MPTLPRAKTAAFLASLAVVFTLAAACSDTNAPKANGADSTQSVARSAAVVLSAPKPNASTAPSAKPSTSAAPKASASASATPADPLANAKDVWPLPADCQITSCKTPEGGPGVSCAPGGRCVNPCLPGMGPEKDGGYCSKLCSKDADCPGGKCADVGVCNFWTQSACEGGGGALCTTPDKRQGFECKGKCEAACKKGLDLYGGTHCAKPCKSDADCPGGGGTCAEGFCGPLCPSEGCPYRWE